MRNACKNQLYDLQCSVLLGILCILQQLGARPVQLYDLLVAFRLGGAGKKDSIIKLGYFLNNAFSFLLDPTQLYDFMSFVSRAWAGVQKANHEVDRFVPRLAEICTVCGRECKKQIIKLKGSCRGLLKYAPHVGGSAAIKS